jgi:hypothetical protein
LSLSAINNNRLRTKLSLLSDAEVRELSPEECFCGLFDRVERINRVYGEELARRGLR